MKVLNTHPTPTPRLRTYAAPRLARLGSIRELTQGGGSASGEGNNPRIKKKS